MAMLSTALTGCVSAVDETSAFGFSSQPKPAAEADVAEAPADAEPEAGSEVAEAAVPAAAEPPATAETEAGRQIAQTAAGPSSEAIRVAEAAESEEAPKARSFLSPTSNPAVSAFAQPRAARESDRSLYASLYTQSEAKVPLRNADNGKSKRVVVHQSEGSAAAAATDNALPGVDPKSLFEIGQRASVDSDLLDDIGGSYQMASLSGIARLAPSGLLIQRDDIVTNCFDSNLMSLIAQIESRFKQKVVITSGYRSPAHNRRVNGAKASMHMACKAADLHVPGTSGRMVAEFVRSLPRRGGVGTYCHTAAIHVDVGPKRDWNWPCRTRGRA